MGAISRVYGVEFEHAMLVIDVADEAKRNCQKSWRLPKVMEPIMRQECPTINCKGKDEGSVTFVKIKGPRT